MRSIRTYLLTRSLGGAGVVLVAAGLAVYLAVTRALQAEFDASLVDRVQGFASILFQAGEEVAFEFSEELMPEYDLGPAPAFFELRYADGELLERSNSLGEEDLVLPEPAGREARHWTAPLPDGRTGRYVCQRIEIHHVYPEQGPDRPRAALVDVVIARGREELVAAQRAVLAQCASGCLAVMVLIGFLVRRAVDRGLAPARRLAAVVDALEVDHLPGSLDLGALPAELAPMGEKTEALVRRVGRALERERRTTADIAHELRTPVSEILTVSEVALRNGRDPESTQRALGTVRDVAWHMGRSITTLLKLAWLEMGAESFESGGVDLGEVVREILRSLAAVERERGLCVDNGVELGGRVPGDGDVLRIVASNLLSNALYHAQPRGSVHCRLERTERRWSLVVENDALDLQPEDLDALTRPFWRKERARSNRERFGLGLALSRALAEKAGMRLDFALEASTFRATLSGAVEAARV